MRNIRNILGFTLVELMIVVSIVGILAAISVPAYSDYVKRAEVSEGLVYADAAKTSVSEAYLSTNSMPANNAAAGLAPANTIVAKYVNGLTVTNGTISVAMSFPGVDPLNNLIVMIPQPNTAGILWFCGTTSATTLPSQYRPSSCK